jgi:AcrR family transcriptional regulator
MGIQERKQREKERRRQQIMVAAKKIFSLKGLNKATMEDIAHEAELSPGTLYLYFKNKDELHASLSLRVLQYLLIRLEHIDSEFAAVAEKRIAALKDVLFDVYTFDPLILLNMFHIQSGETVKNLSPELLEEIQGLSDRALGAIADMFQSGVENGIFKEGPAETFADIVWALFSGIILIERQKQPGRGEKTFVRSTLDAGFDILLRGIRKSA